MQSLATLMGKAAIRDIDMDNLHHELTKLSKQVDQDGFMNIVNSLLPNISVMMAPEYSIKLNLPIMTDMKVSPKGTYLYIYNGGRINVLLSMKDVLEHGYYYKYIDKPPVYKFNPGDRVLEISNDETSIIYFDDQDNYYVLNLLTKTSTSAPFLQDFDRQVQIKDLLLFESNDKPSIARWKNGQLELPGTIPDQLRDMYEKDHHKCYSLILALTDEKFATEFTKLFEETDYPIVSSNCNLWLAKFKGGNKARLVHVTSTELQTVDIELPVSKKLEIKPTKDNRFVILTDHTIYISDFKLGSYSWVPIIRTFSDKDNIEDVRIHSNGFVIIWDTRRNKEDEEPGEPLPSNIITLPSGYKLRNFDNYEEEFFSNYNLKSNSLTFNISITNIDFEGLNHVSSNLIFFNINGREELIRFFDSTGNKINYRFNINLDSAVSIIVNTNNNQIRLSIKNYISDSEHTGGVEYLTNINGLYYTRSYSTKNELIYMDRRISFLRNLIDYKQLFSNVNLPIPAVYPNDLVLDRILDLYSQYPYTELIKAGFDPNAKYLTQRQFERIILNLFYYQLSI